MKDLRNYGYKELYLQATNDEAVYNTINTMEDEDFEVIHYLEEIYETTDEQNIYFLETFESSLINK